MQSPHKPQVCCDHVEKPFTDESLKAFEELGLVLLRIRQRMRSEGYDIINGEVVKIAAPTVKYEHAKSTNAE